MTALSSAQLALVLGFQKETEDLVRATVKDIFLAKNGTVSASVGANAVSLTGDAYDDTTYVINIYEALDGDGIDVRAELAISSKTVSGFTITALTACTVKYITQRLVPKIDASFWT